MEFDHFLVKWVNENPIRMSVMSRNDICDENCRKKIPSALVGVEIGFKWRRLICYGLVIGYGTKTELQAKLRDGSKLLKSNNTPDENVATTKNKRQHQDKNAKAKEALAKKSKSNAVLEELESGPNKDDVINQLQRELDVEKEKRAQAEALCDELKKVAETSDKDHSNVDIGNGILVAKQTLSTLRTVSSTLNIYARNLFKLIFEVHEVVGRSLMGKGCNANKNTEKLPSIDPVKRDAVIDHSLKAFGRVPGSELYKLGLKDLKQSLSCLIREMVTESKKIEESLLQNTGDLRENTATSDIRE